MKVDLMDVRLDKSSGYNVYRSCRVDGRGRNPHEYG